MIVKNSEELKIFTDALTARIAEGKKEDFRKAAKSEANYEAFISEIIAIGSSAIVEFITTRQMTVEDLVEYNRRRVTDLDAWVREKLAALD